MSTLEKIQYEVRQLDAGKQQQVLAYVEWVAVNDQPRPTDSEDESDLEWANFENHAAEASL